MDESVRRRIFRFIKFANEVMDKVSKAKSLQDKEREIDLAEQLLKAAQEQIHAATISTNLLRE